MTCAEQFQPVWNNFHRKEHFFDADANDSGWQHAKRMVSWNLIYLCVYELSTEAR